MDLSKRPWHVLMRQFWNVPRYQIWYTEYLYSTVYRIIGLHLIEENAEWFYAFVIIQPSIHSGKEFESKEESFCILLAGKRSESAIKMINTFRVWLWKKIAAEDNETSFGRSEFDNLLNVSLLGFVRCTRQVTRSNYSTVIRNKRGKKLAQFPRGVHVMSVNFNTIERWALYKCRHSVMCFRYAYNTYNCKNQRCMNLEGL